MKYIFILMITLLSSVAFAQKTPKLSGIINECIIKGTNGDAYLKTKKNFAHFFAIAASFDKEGEIDTIYFSNKLNPETKALYRLDGSLLKRIRIYHLKFKEYASKIVVIPIYYYNINDESVDYKNDFFNSIANVIPEEIYEKAVIILKPIVAANLPSIN